MTGRDAALSRGRLLARRLPPVRWRQRTPARSTAVTTLTAEARELLESDALVHLVTLNPDGGPQLSCVWVGVDGDEIVSAHMLRSQKVRNVERDPRVVLSVEAPGLNEMGLREYLV